MVTTTSITTVSVSMRKAQSTANVPEENQCRMWILWSGASPNATVKNATHERIAATTRKPLVITSAGCIDPAWS